MNPTQQMFPVKVNFQSIAKVAETTETGAAFILKQILLAINQCIKKEVSIKLNMKLGLIKINASGSLTFSS
jgi:hypothetical protein